MRTAVGHESPDPNLLGKGNVVNIPQVGTTRQVVTQVKRKRRDWSRKEFSFLSNKHAAPGSITVREALHLEEQHTVCVVRSTNHDP